MKNKNHIYGSNKSCRCLPFANDTVRKYLTLSLNNWRIASVGLPMKQEQKKNGEKTKIKPVSLRNSKETGYTGLRNMWALNMKWRSD